jgi:hypothetical protein
MKVLKESNKYRDFEWDQSELYAVVKNDGRYAGMPCTSYGAARDMAGQHQGAKIFKLVLEDDATEEPLEEDISSRIRKNNLEGGEGSYWASEDGIDIDIQDREEHTHEFGTTTNQWGATFIGDKKNRRPKVATKTWGRIWKDGKFDKSFEGSKYGVRAEMAKYLDSK